jgi:hypothetical protein
MYLLGTSWLQVEHGQRPTPPPQNVERVIYEYYVDREKSSVFFMLTT